MSGKLFYHSPDRGERGQTVRRRDVAGKLARPQPIERLIYRSEPTGDMRSDMDAILHLAVWANARHRITGVLASVHGRYVQVLEGPAEKLDNLLACLRADSRHCNLVVLYRHPVQSRLFPGWSMARTELAAAHVPRVGLDDGQWLTDQLVEIFRRGETRVA